MEADKKIIGPIEHLKVEECDLFYRSRIDTGAARTSLHAVDIRIDAEKQPAKKNIGKTVTFKTQNDIGETREVQAVISGVVKLKNSMGISTRYAIPLTISWHGEQHQVEAVLADRSYMDYNLLIGRDWLSGVYVVDVDYPDEY